MRLKKLFTRMVLGCLSLSMMLFSGSAANAQVLYGATGSNGIDGQLVTINTLTGSATVIGALQNVAGSPYGLTALAFHPTTGVLYGATTPNSTTSPSSLVTIDPATGVVTTIGSFGLPTGSFGDLAFSSTGVLFGTRTIGGNLFTVNLATGTGTLIGASGIATGSSGHGMAMSSAGTLFTVPDAQFLYTFNTGTGVATQGVAVTGGPFNQNINAMDFNTAGTLFAVNTNNSLPASTHLVTLNTSTGVITDIGASIDDLDAISFQTIAVPEPATISLIGCCALAVGGYYWRKRTQEAKKAAC